MIAVLMIASGCVAPQPASLQTVAAYEVPLPSMSDRSEFLDLVRREAKAEGLHVDSTRSEELEATADAVPRARMTIHAGVWRGVEDDESEAVIMDGYDHLGLVWVMFARGRDVELARQFRDRLMRKVVARWPQTLSLPVMPTGSIPLHSQLIRTPSGYKLDPGAISSYGVDASSSLVARH